MQFALDALEVAPDAELASKGQEVTVERTDSRPKARRRSGSQGQIVDVLGLRSGAELTACWMVPFEAVPEGAIPSDCAENQGC